MWNPFRKKVLLQPEILEAPEPKFPLFTAIKQGTMNGTIGWKCLFVGDYPTHFYTSFTSRAGKPTTSVVGGVSGGQCPLSYFSVSLDAGRNRRWILEVEENPILPPVLRISFDGGKQEAFLSVVREQAFAAAQEKEASTTAAKAAREQALLNSLKGREYEIPQGNEGDGDRAGIDPVDPGQEGSSQADRGDSGENAYRGGCGQAGQ